MKLKDFLDVYDDADIEVYDLDIEEYVYDDEKEEQEHWTVGGALYPYYSRKVDTLYAGWTADHAYSKFTVYIK